MLINDLRVLKNLLRPVKGDTQAELMENFYSAQAEFYDDFRRRLLHGRDELFDTVEWSHVKHWVDLGAGTGSNLELVPAHDLQSIELVDLSPSLLRQAQKRVEKMHLTNATCVQGDATTFEPEAKPDLISFTYSLTMIPDWFEAINHAWEILEPGGYIAVADFFVSRKRPSMGQQKHDYFTRTLWPLWFSYDNVFLNADHLPYLKSKFTPVCVKESKGTVPYLPSVVKVPYYLFIGQKT